MGNEKDSSNLGVKKKYGSRIQDCYVSLNRMDARLMKYYLKKYGLKLRSQDHIDCVSDFQSVPSAKKLKIEQDLSAIKDSNSSCHLKENLIKRPIKKNNFYDFGENTADLINQKNEERQTTENDCKTSSCKTSSLAGVLQNRQTNIDDFSSNEKKQEIEEIRNLGADLLTVENEVKKNEITKNCVSEKRVETIHEKTKLKNETKMSVEKSDMLKRKVIELIVLDNDTYLEDDRRTTDENEVTERLKKNVINSVNDKKIIRERNYDCNKLTEKKELEEVDKIITEISHLVKNLHNSDLLIQCLKEDMKQHLDLKDHFTKVIISQKEKFRNEIWKSQETIMKGYDQLMSKCTNPSDVTLKISRQSHLSIEEVDSIISQCILVEARCHSESERQKEETEKKEGNTFVKKLMERDCSVDNSKNVKIHEQIQTNIEKETNDQQKYPQQRTALEQSDKIRSMSSDSVCQKYLPQKVSQLNCIPSEKPTQVQVSCQEMPHLNCQVQEKGHPLSLSKYSNLPPITSDSEHPQYLQCPPSYNRIDPQSVSQYYSLPPIGRKYPVSIADVYAYFNLNKNDSLVPMNTPAPISENVVQISRPDTATLYGVASVSSAPRSSLPLQQSLMSKPLVTQPPVVLAPPASNHSVFQLSISPSQAVFRPQLPPQVITSAQFSPLPQQAFIRTNFSLPPTVNKTQLPLSLPRTRLPQRPAHPVTNMKLPLLQPKAVTQTQLCRPSPQTVIRTQLPPQAIIYPQLPSSSSQAVNQVQLPSPQTVLPSQCVTQQTKSSPPVMSSPKVIHDPTVPQKLMLKDRRLQAGGIIKFPEVVPEQTEKEGMEEDIQIVQISLKNEKKILRTRTVLCAQTGCMNAGVRICKECRSVIYCSRDCQLKHWKVKHKEECGKLKELRVE